MADAYPYRIVRAAFQQAFRERRRLLAACRTLGLDVTEVEPTGVERACGSAVDPWTLVTPDGRTVARWYLDVSRDGTAFRFNGDDAVVDAYNALRDGNGSAH